jgi:hypothetical protein
MIRARGALNWGIRKEWTKRVETKKNEEAVMTDGKGQMGRAGLGRIV